MADGFEDPNFSHLPGKFRLPEDRLQDSSRCRWCHYLVRDSLHFHLWASKSSKFTPYFDFQQRVLRHVPPFLFSCHRMKITMAKAKAKTSFSIFTIVEIRLSVRIAHATPAILTASA